MKKIWITESGIIHHRKPEMEAKEFVEAQPDAALLDAVKAQHSILQHLVSSSRKYHDGYFSGGQCAQIQLIETKLGQAIARAEQKGEK